MQDNLNDLFGNFLNASTCKAVLGSFALLCDAVDITYPPAKNESYDHCTFYSRLKSTLTSSWKAKSLFAKLDKKYYDKTNFTNARTQRDTDRVAKDCGVLIVGAGPCGLRTSVLMALLGAKTMVVEKRDSFSRNNVLHLWPFTIDDLKSLGAKKFNGRFCSGAIDHVSIRQLQLILMKAALLFGVEIHVNTSFVELVAPDDGVMSWKAKVEPASSPVSDFEFIALIGADGRKNTLKGFEKKVFRASLAIGITVNFINKHTTEEAKVPEISGINFIYRQDFFRDLNKKHGIDLENIVYYRDDTHYFVMTARKKSLLQRRVFKNSLDDPAELVSYKNIDQAALLNFALDAVNFSTHNKLPDLEVAINAYGLPDIALFDFTCMKSSVNSCMFKEVNGVKLFQGLVGDGLLEPFWPKGTGIAKGFLASLDTAWTFRQWVVGRNAGKTTNTPLELSLLAEREAIYRVLAQTETKALSQDYTSYTIDPRTRYQYVPKKLAIKQVEQFYVSDQKVVVNVENKEKPDSSTVPSSLTRNVSFVQSNKLLHWCETILRKMGAKLPMVNMNYSWKNGLALCYIICHFRPDLIDVENLDPSNAEFNNQLAFDTAEEQLGITPVMSGKEMAESEVVDDLLMVSYISQFYEVFKNEKPPSVIKTVDNDQLHPPQPVIEDSTKVASKKKSPVGFLARLSQQIKRKSGHRGSARGYDLEDHDAKRKKTLPKKSGMIAENDSKDIVLTKAVTSHEVSDDKENTVVMRKKADGAVPGVKKNATNRISALGQQLISQFEQNSPQPVRAKDSATLKKGDSNSNVCYFCAEKVYIVERLSVEGLFFHRQCFTCSYCNTPLRPMNYKRDFDTGKFYCAVHFYAHSEVMETVTESQPDNGVSVAGSDDNNAFEAETDGTLVPTIENGKVVMKRDFSQRKESTDNLDESQEVTEDDLNKHNIRCSNSAAESDNISSDSDSEDWDAIAKESLGMQDKSPLEILNAYHSKSLDRENSNPSFLNATGRTDETLLSSASDGDEEVSSLSSASGHSDHVDDGEEEDVETMSISSVSSEDSEIERFVDTQAVVAFEGAGNINHQERDLVTSAAGDTLDRVAKYIHETPVSASRRSAVSSKSSDESSDSEAGEADQAIKFKVGSPSAVSISSESSPSIVGSPTSPVPVFEDASDAAPTSSGRNNTTVWACDTDSTEKVSLSSEPEVKKFGQPTNTQSAVNGAGSVQDVAMDCKEHDVQMNVPGTPEEPGTSFLTPTGKVPNHTFSTSSVDTDCYFTPAADKTHSSQNPFDSFDTIQSDSTPNNSALNESFMAEPGAPGSPETQTSDALPRPRKLPDPPGSTGRRRLPKIPHMEALSPTGKEPTSQEERIKRQLKKHEERVQARIRKMKEQTTEKSNRSKSADGLASSENVTTDVLGEEFMQYIPTLIEKRNATKQKHKGDKHSTNKKDARKKSPNIFAFRNKKKRPKAESTERPATSMEEENRPREMSPSYRRSRKYNSSTSYTPEQIENKISYRVRVAAQRQAKEAERKRMARALVIQSQLEEVDAKQKLLEERGVKLEKSLRADRNTGPSPKNNSYLMHEWFKLVQEKNALLRFENELMIYQRELQLEDRQSRLQQDLRERMAIDDAKKSPDELAKEKAILSEMLEVVEQRDQLVALLDEHRVQDKAENADIEGLLIEKFSGSLGYNMDRFSTLM